MGASPEVKPSAREPLNSNILNYLVWRYLQESGFGMAATWLGREWHRNPDAVMPFAKHVKQYSLINIVQDGLFLDDVRAQGDRVCGRIRVLSKNLT
jgi:transducin (beta)-like 1